MSEPTQVKVKIHQGHALMTLARHYYSIPAVIMEIVQNAIDAGATKIAVEIDKPKNMLVVCDNGSGASREKVTQALQSVAATMKSKDKYGQFGIGLISPLAVSGKFLFTSCPTPRYNDYVEYVFVTKDIAEAPEVSIPQRSVPNFQFDPQGKTWWRTRVEATKLTQERRPSTVIPKELVAAIALKYGEAIRARSIQISIEMTDDTGIKTSTQVEAPQYTGIKLATFTGSQVECGDVKIGLYLARLQKGGRKGSIAFGTMDNPSRISGEQFAKCAKELLDPQVAKALMSGVFEGCITCKKVSLHPDRTKFEDNDALFALCEVIEGWYKKVGKKTYEEAGEQAQDQYFQDVGRSVMSFIDMLAAQPQFAEVMSKIKIGTIGSGHVRVPKKAVIGTEDATSLSADGGAGGTRSHHNDSDEDRNPPKSELKSHVPATVYGPKGKRRTEVRGNSTGIRLEHVDMEDFRIPFEFTRESGTLSINTNHTLFGRCQKEKAFLQQYHGIVATIAFSLEMHRNKDGSINPELVNFAHESLENQVFGIENGKSLIG
ncbi:MAG: ATP-binding protein [Patescibacteria group bacterium]